jgi:hypothetical protein
MPLDKCDSPYYVLNTRYSLQYFSLPHDNEIDDHDSSENYKDNNINMMSIECEWQLVFRF